MYISVRAFAPRLVGRRVLAPSALEPTSYPESISDAVLIAEAVMAPEADTTVGSAIAHIKITIPIRPLRLIIVATEVAPPLAP